jgi:hypothetical protein
MDRGRLQSFMHGRLGWALLAAVILTAAAVTAGFLKP